MDLRRPQRRPHRLPVALLLVAPIVLLTLTGPPAAAHPEAPGHAHLFVSLGDDSETDTIEPDDRLTFRFIGARIAEAGDGDTTQVRVPLPDNVDLQRLHAADAGDTTTRIDDSGPTREALLIWQGDGPRAGETVSGVTLEGIRNVDPRGSFTARWPGLDTLEEVDARVELPSGHTLSSSADLDRTAHGTRGRTVWTQNDLAVSTLELSVRPPFTGTDPTRSEPPSPVAGWAIVFGIALVAGAIWAIGKKLDNRSKE